MRPRYPRRAARTPRRTLAALALAVAVVGAACGDDEWVTAPATVVVAGDSLVFQSGDPLPRALEAKGWQAHLDGRPGSTITGGSTIDSWPDRLRDLVAQYDPDAVVVVLGTNGCRCRSLAAGIDAVMRPLRRVPRVYWVGVREDAPVPDDPVSVNEALEAAEHRYGNLDVLDLDDHFDERPELIDRDGIHFNDAGEREFSRWIADHLPAPPTDAR
jgi:lysophospholipase L1-like esterase